MARRLGVGLLVAVLLLLGAWIAALKLLPDAPASVSVSAPEARPVADAGRAGPLAMPVAGLPREAVRESWGDPRENGLREHHGTDIPAPLGTPVVAAAPGVVEKLWNSAAGGTTVYVRSPKKDWIYYYAHLSGYAPGLRERQVVKTGDPIGFVGDTGNAGAGNYHLHFGLTRTTPDQHWYEGRDVDPYPYLVGS
ncbi:M23 family metallopeptidase [Sphingomonas aliaeris]|uniref:M23 family metallopeptidase n=1 Tax=Sphingomonas aliaeris TaxID=2759526 RepID=A0A974NSJ8_9SPHN|nr:M23 family metallopeptidase [Sphingomonas aliaeris]QQV76175.1 M23 family metallopeptidase [Sphingomonas aliaeris]